MKANSICIVDDDPIFVYGTKVLLNHNKDIANDILVYENGKEALDSLSAMVEDGDNLPDIIFLDLNMPVMDGWRFLEAFIKIPIDKMPLVFIATSSIDEDDKLKAKQYPIVKEFLTKPLSESLLRELIEKYNYS